MISRFLIPSLALAITFTSTQLLAFKAPLLPGLYKRDMQIYMDGKKFDPMAEIRKQMKDNPQMAQMMANMKMPGTQLEDLCVTPEDLSKDIRALLEKGDPEADGSCKNTITSQTQKEIKGKMTCKNGSTGDFTIKFIGSKKYEMDMTGTFEGKKNMRFKTSGTFIKGQC